MCTLLSFTTRRNSTPDLMVYTMPAGDGARIRVAASVNYSNTFIKIAPDCPATNGTIPVARGSRKPMHLTQYEVISKEPYKHTQEDVLWMTHRIHKNIRPGQATAAARKAFFSRGQPCLRASALAKKYGWGFHFNRDGGVKLVAAGTPEYKRYVKKESLQQLTAMRNRRAT